MANQSLMAHADDKLALWHLLSESGGEITPVMQAWLDEIETGLATKVDSYKFVIDDLELESQRLKAKAKDINAAAKSLENLADSIKERMKAAMTKMGVNEVMGQDYRYRLTTGIQRLEIMPEVVSKDWFMQVVTLEPDKARIRAALDQGEFIPGARLVDSPRLTAYVNKGNKK